MQIEIEKVKSFSSVNSYRELKLNLEKKAKGLQNTHNGATKYLCHYTSIDTAVAIIKSGVWYIGSPKNMNDGLELSHADDAVCDNIFFSSFMIEPTESIAMWSMYAQPWADGVMIRIPIEKMKKLVFGTPVVSSADAITKKSNGDKITNDVIVSFHAVAYTNADSKSVNEEEFVRCGEETNNLLSDINTSNDLIGYVKNVAWSYENEYRIRVENTSKHLYDAVAIKLSDEIINSMEIIAGPRFDGSLSDRISTKAKNLVSIDHLGSSIFTGKLNYIYCDRCTAHKK